MTKTPSERRDEVLLRMLKTPPMDHAEVKAKAKKLRKEKPARPRKTKGDDV